MIKTPSLQCLAYLRNALHTSSRRSTCRSLGSEHCRRAHTSRHTHDITAGTTANICSQLSESGQSRRIRVRRKSLVPLSELRSHASLPKPIIQSLESEQLQKILLQCQRAEAWKELTTIYENYHENVGLSIPRKDSFHCYILAQYKLRNHRVLYNTTQDMLAKPSTTLYTIETVNILLQHMIKQGRTFDAINVLIELQRSKYPLDVVSYNTVLNGARAGQCDEKYMKTVLHMMSSHNIQYSAETYNIIIAAYFELSMSDVALQYFRMAINERKADTSSYNTIISRELSYGTWHSAWNLVLAMRERGVTTNERTYSPFLLYLTKNKMHGRWLKELMQLMSRDSVALGSASYNTLLHKLLFSGMLDQAGRLLLTMKKQSVKVTERTFDVILQFYRNCTGEFLSHPLHATLAQFTLAEVSNNPNVLAYSSVKILQESKNLWKGNAIATHQALPLTMTDTAGEYLDVKALGDQIQDFMRHGSWRSALASYQSFQARGISPPVQTVINMLVGLLNHDRYHEAQQIYHAMKKEHRSSSSIQFQTVVLNLLRPENIARDIQRLLNFLSKTESRIDIIFHSAAAWRLYREQKYPEAISLLRYAIGLGILVDLAACVILVECYAKTRDLVGTIWCLRTMHDNKIILDRQARKRFKRVIKTLEDKGSANEVQEARELLLRLNAAAAHQRAVRLGLAGPETKRKDDNARKQNNSIRVDEDIVEDEEEVVSRRAASI